MEGAHGSGFRTLAEQVMGSKSVLHMALAEPFTQLHSAEDRSS
jgi:hypothetical protein